jgi:hypothetical protein
VLERLALVGEKSAILHDPASQSLSRTDVFAINTVSEWVKQTILSDVDSDLHDAIHQINNMAPANVPRSACPYCPSRRGRGRRQIPSMGTAFQGEVERRQ